MPAPRGFLGLRTEMNHPHRSTLNKPSITGSEIAAALIACASSQRGSQDNYLALYFETLAKILDSARDERWPHVASWRQGCEHDDSSCVAANLAGPLDASDRPPF
jgi:hypothetical protein